jgi:hypothetical protein
MHEFDRNGFAVWENDPDILAWIKAARPFAQEALFDPVLRQKWFVCEGTWFVGVDALANEATGAIGGVPLKGAVMEFIENRFGHFPFHPAQLSVTFKGYPKPRAGESDAAFAYRLNRDAAHVDGILGLGTPKRRFMREPHGYILGLPLNEAAPSPLVVWQGSHKIFEAAFREVFAGLNQEQAHDLDITEIYQSTRRRVFETCQRIEVHATQGQAILMDPLVLHGVAPWGEAPAIKEGRQIAYFRPQSWDQFLLRTSS